MAPSPSGRTLGPARGALAPCVSVARCLWAGCLDAERGVKLHWSFASQRRIGLRGQPVVGPGPPSLQAFVRNVFHGRLYVRQSLPRRAPNVSQGVVSHTDRFINLRAILISNLPETLSGLVP